MRFVIYFFFLGFLLSAQTITKKEYSIQKTDQSIKIDGVFDESVWKNVPIAKDFVMFTPGAGDPEPEDKKTEVKILYNDQALFFAITLYENEMNKVPRQILGRDDFGNTDYFGVIINPKNDGQTDFEFFVQSTGNQGDALSNPSFGEDFSWDAVWDSKVKNFENRWQIEIRIPFSALRFDKKDVNAWGLNFHRHYRSTRNQYTWNFIDRSKGVIGQYNGLLKGLTDIEPPIRLSLFPFISGYAFHKNGESSYQLKGGADIKYGLNDNFTLDATLIPDFGQAGFDEIVLNLGPFEQQLTEKRQFFSEGVEFFNKGNLFYSRRIGGTPNKFHEVNNKYDDIDSVKIIGNPDQVKTINAFKISGRNNDGWGFGFFNAITNKTEATIEEANGEKRKIETNPYTLYNMMVVDKILPHNSTVSFLNTTVLRNGSARDANVSSLRWNLNDKPNKYNLNGSFTANYINPDGDVDNLLGYYGDIEVAKIDGKHNYSLGFDFKSKNYNINDLGINFENNIKSLYSNYNFRILKPTNHFVNIYFNYWANYSWLWEPVNNPLANNTFNDNYFLKLSTGFSSNFTTKKFLSFGLYGYLNPVENRNFWDPQTKGAFVNYKPNGEINAWISSDYRKKFALDANLMVGKFWDNSRKGRSQRIRVSPIFNVSDQLRVRLTSEYTRNFDELGFVKSLSGKTDTVIFGLRDFDILENSLNASYNFTPVHTLSVSLRHYWATVDYGKDKFYDLQGDGDLSEREFCVNNTDVSLFNFDLNYRWRFAPGSDLSVLYRNNFHIRGDEISSNYWKSLNQIRRDDFGHVLSVSVTMFLDYNSI
jgi:hypothetical protein